MDATAKMKAGESWDLLADLANHPEFGMTKAEMREAIEAAEAEVETEGEDDEAPPVFDAAEVVM